MPLIVNQLKYSYQPQNTAGYSFTLNDSELTALVGMNGAGKSSLIKTLSGEITPEAGDIQLNQFPLNSSRKKYKQHTGYMPDIFPVPKNQTAREFLLWVASCYKISQKKASSLIKSLASQLNLHELLNNKVSQLSLGQKQRLSLAQALINEPQCLFLDEPLNGLDPTQQTSFWDTIKNEDSERSTLIASHHINDVLEHCHRILIIDAHSLVADIAIDKTKVLLFSDEPIIQNKASSYEKNINIIHPKIWGFNNHKEAENVATQLSKEGIKIEELKPALLNIFSLQAKGKWSW
ncbi:ABC transporter ATP-binding protein [Pleionea sediminis]|uniref:ABC transporter ATP-binding protein n=1 Tax=Pleionea sediminis TaxID=2569479 RepID=UPI0011870B31|nr:ABC transporter ATP-binding protein [Pleionea sediminis]